MFVEAALAAEGVLPFFGFAPEAFGTAGRLGTRLGSYVEPADTWTMVMRTFVGKNFS